MRDYHHLNTVNSVFRDIQLADGTSALPFEEGGTGGIPNGYILPGGVGITWGEHAAIASGVAQVNFPVGFFSRPPDSVIAQRIVTEDKGNTTPFKNGLTIDNADKDKMFVESVMGSNAKDGFFWMAIGETNESTDDIASTGLVNFDRSNLAVKDMIVSDLKGIDNSGFIEYSMVPTANLQNYYPNETRDFYTLPSANGVPLKLQFGWGADLGSNRYITYNTDAPFTSKPAIFINSINPQDSNNYGGHAVRGPGTTNQRADVDTLLGAGDTDKPTPFFMAIGY